MKKIIITLVLSLIFIPGIISAHGSAQTDFNKVQGGTDMMQYVEEQALGADVHAEMETLMEKMIDGTMTEGEAGEMITLMKENPGPYNMMMDRLTMMNQGSSYNRFSGHMFGGGGGGLSWLMGLWSIIWLAIGVLVIVWLWKQITKK